MPTFVIRLSLHYRLKRLDDIRTETSSVVRFTHNMIKFVRKSAKVSTFFIVLCELFSQKRRSAYAMHICVRVCLLTCFFSGITGSLFGAYNVSHAVISPLLSPALP